MPGEIEFFYEFASPYSYIAAQRLPALAEGAGRTIRWRPIELLKVWAGQGILEGYRTIQKAKRAYILADARRVAASLGVTLMAPKTFPPDASLARLVVHGLEAVEPGRGAALTLNLWRRFWAEGRDISTIDDLIEAAPQGVVAAVLRAAAEDACSREFLEAANSAAIAASCFGVPWFMADGEAYFGQDRLELMVSRLAQRHDARTTLLPGTP